MRKNCFVLSPFSKNNRNMALFYYSSVSKMILKMTTLASRCRRCRSATTAARYGRYVHICFPLRSFTILESVNV